MSSYEAIAFVESISSRVSLGLLFCDKKHSYTGSKAHHIVDYPAVKLTKIPINRHIHRQSSYLRVYQENGSFLYLAVEVIHH
jgi:hypothetical protein